LQSGDTLLANAGAVSYQWYHDGNLVNGATNYFFVAQASGDYNVVATDANGCEVEAVIFDVIAEIKPVADNGNIELVVFPNPVSSYLSIDSRYINAEGTITIYNMLGEKVYADVDYRQLTLDCRLLSPGMYWLEISSGEKKFHARFLKSSTR